MQAFLVSENETGFSGAWNHVSEPELLDGHVRIQLEYSSLNYKDALSYAGNKGVTRKFPHVPGIDAAGVVVSSQSDFFSKGDEVLVTGYDLGMNTFGGFADLVAVPENWIIKRPIGFSALDAMILGTAGLTAGLCVDKLLHNDIKPDQGSILVSGASGGVGSIACKLLSKLGFNITAVQRDNTKQGFLESLGVTDFISMDELLAGDGKPLLKPAFAAAIDVAGGKTLAAILKQIKPSGSVAACGLVDNLALDTTVLPFILRGINLLGVDSVEIPLSQKQAVWNKFAEDWKIDAQYQLIEREQLKDYLEALLKGEAKGRYVLKLK
ncbi:YhdH/YhfP family quinone oxidoreductase [Bermanella marisrubri]|uniref:Probable oxidoreductase n=1 Tax=Bermanella marisrubri TaxID=207949 RepID=Q1MXX7_9GAMM|nr:YhdH/YhfP family quinone oxidoreductase [Bermanella marisrubri]EAT10852.1 probable oxidoreductase [Oceanobacter sp. RED65] [Bermanella marisrubri]